MASKILLVNQQNIRFLFRNTGEVYINDVYKGAGILVTPIEDIGLRKNRTVLSGTQELFNRSIEGMPN